MRQPPGSGQESNSGQIRENIADLREGCNLLGNAGGIASEVLLWARRKRGAGDAHTRRSAEPTQHVPGKLAGFRPPAAAAKSSSGTNSPRSPHAVARRGPCRLLEAACHGRL